MKSADDFNDNIWQVLKPLDKKEFNIETNPVGSASELDQ